MHPRISASSHQNITPQVFRRSVSTADNSKEEGGNVELERTIFEMKPSPVVSIESWYNNGLLYLREPIWATGPHCAIINVKASILIQQINDSTKGPPLYSQKDGLLLSH